MTVKSSIHELFSEMKVYEKVLSKICSATCDTAMIFPVFGLTRERYGIPLRIQSEYEKIRTRITLNTDTFHAV